MARNNFNLSRIPDNAKNKANISKHGVSFKQASESFGRASNPCDMTANEKCEIQ